MDTVTPAPSAATAPTPDQAVATRVRVRANRPLVVIATVAVVMLLYFGAPFFIPLFVSLLIAFALSPVVDLIARVVRVRVLAAAIVVLAVIGLMGAAAYAWSDDVVTIWEEIPVAAKSISKSLQKLAQKPAGSFGEVKKAAAELESVAQGGKAGPATSPVAAATAAATQPVSMWQLVMTGGKAIAIGVSQLLVVVFLVFFMLASGNLFKRKIVILSGEKLTQRKLTVEMLDEIDLQVRRYLLVLMVSNLLVGAGTWAVFHFAGLQYAGASSTRGCGGSWPPCCTPSRTSAPPWSRPVRWSWRSCNRATGARR
jgi:predicted PurR-regulated permease PerM